MATEIAELLAALRSGSDDDKANAAFALGNLAKRDPASQAAIASAGAIPLLVALVASGSLESRAKAARAITALACGNDTNRNGIISALLVLLLTGSKESQANAAYAFARLCANDVSERSLNQQAIASAGAIPLLVSLSLHDADAWWALTALRGENEANLFAIVASLVSTGPDNSAYAVVDRLAELAENPQTHATIASAGAIPFLVSRLSTVRHEGDIIAVCLAIGRLVSTRDPGVKAAIMSTNVISLLVGVLPMIDAITKAGALNKPFWVLTNLEDDTNRTAFATAFVGILRNITETNRINTLKAIVHVAEIGLFKLWAEMTSPDVLPLLVENLVTLLINASDIGELIASRGLARLANSDENLNTIATSGAIPLLVSLLTKGDRGYLGKDDASARVLCRLAGCESHRLVIASAGAIPPLVALLTNGYQRAKVNAAEALRWLALSEDHRSAIVSAGAIQPLVMLLENGDDLERESASHVLKNLMLSEANRPAILTAMLLPIVTALTNGDDQGKVKAADVLQSLALSEDQRSAIASAGAIPPLVALLANGDDEGKSCAARALGNLSLSEANRPAIASAGAIPPLIALLTNGDDEGKSSAARALGNLSLSEANRPAIASAGAIPPLIALLTNGDDQGKVKAADVLRSLAMSEGQRSAIVSAGAIPPLVALLANGDDEGKSSASLALRELMPSSESSRNSVPVDSEEGHAVLHRVLNSSDHDMLIAFSSAYLRGVTRDFDDSRVLGRGSFGVVYEAVDERVRCRYAVKRLSVEAANIRRMLAQEVRILSRFFHPNIVRLVGYCDDHADLCLVYELAGKGSVDKILRDDGEARHFTWRHRVRAMCHVAKALNYLHKHDPNSPVFHRDVKSANIALTDTFEAKLIDCGLAKLLDENEPLVGVGGTIYTPTAAGSPLRFGTLGYTCSTYMRSGNFDAKSEIFSFGVTLLEVVTGRVQSCPDDLLMLFIEDDEEGDGAARLEDSFDRRAGEWPRELIDGLAQLIRQSCRKYTRRIPRMESVMRSLLELEARFCVETEEEAYFRRQYQTLLGDIERLRLEGLQKENELRAMQRTCTLCFGDDNLAGVECASGHFVCDSCFDHHVQAQCELSMEVLRGRDGGVLCPRNNAHYTPQCRAEAFSDQVVAQHVRDHTYVRYLGVRRSIWEHVIFQKSQAAIEQIRQQVGRQMSEELARNQLRESLQRDMPNARMCGRCGFGPVDHAFCYNLRTHHGETVGRGGRVAAINNACPQCGWFADEIAQWPTWDGVLWEERQQAGKGESFTAYTSAACL
ncbi:hypothetical protein P43SY_005421 [Pythium insidiosum]|uniref:Protein kinase domain-containing protein n=1 Tax=Pythium insidiosum TaxID=114742 RepID=A0AAD5LTE3_PYTIN|nr:hypothetical protein P43SY_005421 [Pythium insidiosum]